MLSEVESSFLTVAGLASFSTSRYTRTPSRVRYVCMYTLHAGEAVGLPQIAENQHNYLQFKLFHNEI